MSLTLKITFRQPDDHLSNYFYCVSCQNGRYQALILSRPHRRSGNLQVVTLIVNITYMNFKEYNTTEPWRLLK